jgi:glycosyltransferase involved in cell wall biosynthesis
MNPKCKNTDEGHILAIDASNISSGGGLTHLVQLLTAATPVNSNIIRVHIWTSEGTAQKLPKREWLDVHTPEWCRAGLVRRLIGQQFLLPAMLKSAACDLLFSPGGTLPVRCPIPTVTLSQNMLPFEPERSALFGRWSWMRLKMYLLRFSQGRSFRRSQGVIFLTKYAYDTVKEVIGDFGAEVTVIPHGIESRFVMKPRLQRSFKTFSNHAMQLLYVSIQMPYKHHLEVMEAVAKLRGQGLALRLHMVGENTSHYGKAVLSKRLELDPDENFILDLGHVDFNNLHELYRLADSFIFASSCENLPNILIEAMAAGLPIACAQRGPMLEVLGDAGVYFDPEIPDSVAQAIAYLANDQKLRSKLAQIAWQRAQGYSWERCARETFDFIDQVARLHA